MGKIAIITVNNTQDRKQTGEQIINNISMREESQRPGKLKYKVMTNESKTAHLTHR